MADPERKLAASLQGYTTTELATMYGVNPATIYRGLIMLQSMGVTVVRDDRHSQNTAPPLSSIRTIASQLPMWMSK